jgi:hypothetical protein
LTAVPLRSSLEDAASLDDSPRQKVAMSAPLTRRNTL